MQSPSTPARQVLCPPHPDRREHKRFSGGSRHQPSRSEVPSPGRWIRSGRHPGCGIRPRIRRLADLSSTHPIRRRPCADPVQKQVSGEWMTQKGIDLSRPVTEARMSVAKSGANLTACDPACRFAHAGYACFRTLVRRRGQRDPCEGLRHTGKTRFRTS